MDTKIDWTAVGKVGIPGIIAMFLVYNIVTGFEKFDIRLQALETQHTVAATAATDAKDLAGRALMTNERVLWVLQVMCTNEAKTADARERCIRER
jgi:hypothetical protein